VNPDHLFLGTQLDNQRDMARKGRAHGHRPKSLDAEIVSRYAEGDVSLRKLAKLFRLGFGTVQRITARA
jgi:hypothetical protein